MFVNSIDISEFRGIRSCDKPLKLSNFNILIGRNNAGKTTILEALSLLPKPNTPISIYKEEKNNTAFLLELHHSKRPNNIPLLYFYTGISNIKYFVNGNEYSIRINQNNFEHFSSNQIIQDNKPLFSIYNTDQFRDLVIYIPFNTEIIEKMELKIEDIKDIINKEGYNVKIAETINKCLDDKYSEIIFRESIFLRKDFGNKKYNYVDLRDLGSGAEKVIKIMAIGEVLKPKILLMDDIEAGLHPSLIKVFLTWLKEKEFQVVFSTHSLDVLYSILDIEPSDLSIFQLKKSQDDILYHKILKLEDLEDLLSGNMDPRILVDALNL